MNCEHLDWAICAKCFRDLTKSEQAAIQQADGSAAEYARNGYKPMHSFPADVTEPVPSPAIVMCDVVQTTSLPAIQPPEPTPAPTAAVKGRKRKVKIDQGSLF